MTIERMEIKLPHIDDSGERLIYDIRGANELHETFWAHLARYLHARRVAAASHRKLRILDAACGTGYGTYLMSREGHDCTGIDLDAGAVTFSISRYARSNCNFLCGDVTDLPFEDNSFDMVITFETLEHLARHQQPVFLAEIKRVLRPDGRVTLSSPVRDKGVSNPAENPYHKYEPSSDELMDIARQLFDRVDVYGQVLLPPVSNSEPRQAQRTNQIGTVPMLRYARAVARGIMNTAFQDQYLHYPGLLDFVTRTLYAGVNVKPLSASPCRVSCLVLNAQA